MRFRIVWNPGNHHYFLPAVYHIGFTGAETWNLFCVAECQYFSRKIATFQMSIASAQNLLLIINLYHDEAWDISDLLGAKLRL